MPTLIFIWSQRPPKKAASYRMHFDDRDAALSFMERIVEGRVPEANWEVRCDDGIRRKLGGAIECYCK